MCWPPAPRPRQVAKSHVLLGRLSFRMSPSLTVTARDVSTALKKLQTVVIDGRRIVALALVKAMHRAGVRLADLVLLDADPLSDIRNTRRIAGVVVDGRYLPRTGLRNMLASVEAAARRTKVDNHAARLHLHAR